MFDALLAAAQAMSLVLGLSGDPGLGPVSAPPTHQENPAPAQGDHR